MAMELWTDIAEWRGPSPNTGDGDARLDEPEDQAVEQRGVILHIAEGYYEGTISWQRNPAADVSSQFVVAGPRDLAKTGTPDGKIAQCVPVDIRAWTQRDGNGHWLSIECSGFGGDALSPAQIDACAKIFARAHTRFGVPLQLATSPTGRGLGHHSMGAENGFNWGHDQCPGTRIKAQKPLILSRAIQLVNGGQAATEGDDMPAFLVLHQPSGKVYRISNGLAQYLPAPLVAPGGPVSDVQVHQAGLLGNLMTGDPKRGWSADGRMFLTAGDMRVWGHVVGDPDLSPIVDGGPSVDLAELKAEIRDAVADLGEGGAAKVRADASE